MDKNRTKHILGTTGEMQVLTSYQEIVTAKNKLYPSPMPPMPPTAVPGMGSLTVVDSGMQPQHCLPSMLLVHSPGCCVWQQSNAMVTTGCLSLMYMWWQELKVIHYSPTSSPLLSLC